MNQEKKKKLKYAYIVIDRNTKIIQEVFSSKPKAELFKADNNNFQIKWYALK